MTQGFALFAGIAPEVIRACAREAEASGSRGSPRAAARGPHAMRRLGVAILAGLMVATVLPAAGQTPRRGGILNAMLAEDPPSFSIHESATISGVWPVAPCYSNLVLFDPLKPLETADTVIPELAEKWSWRQVARRSAVHVEGRQVYARRSPRGPGRSMPRCA